jgi:hypothetical protein
LAENEDDEDEEYDSDEDMNSDSDETIDIKFTELGSLPSAARSETSPQDLLGENPKWPCTDSTHYHYFTVLQRAIKLEDLDAFVHITDLYKGLTPSLPLPEDTLNHILNADQPDMLDEYLRRTGVGVPVVLRKEPAEEEDLEKEVETSDKVRSKKRVYYGLDVHGKKRKDLARHGDPDAHERSQPTTKTPILWDAAQKGAIKIVKYLNTSRPAEAYAAFATKQNNARARVIRQTPELTTAVAGWLGWQMNAVNESVLIAAIMGEHNDIINELFALKGDLMTEAVKTP